MSCFGKPQLKEKMEKKKKKYTKADLKKDIEAYEKWEDEMIDSILLRVTEIQRDIFLCTSNPDLSIDDFLNLKGIKKRRLEISEQKERK